MNQVSNKSLNGMVKTISLASLLIALPSIAQDASPKAERPEPSILTKTVDSVTTLIEEFDLERLEASFSECDQTCLTERKK